MTFRYWLARQFLTCYHINRRDSTLCSSQTVLQLARGILRFNGIDATENEVGLAWGWAFKTIIGD